MKLIIAVIRPETLEAVQNAVNEAGACIVSIGQVGDGQTLLGCHRGAAIRIPQPRLRLEIVVVNELLTQDAVEGIIRAGSTDAPARSGNGSIVIMPIDEYSAILNHDYKPWAEPPRDCVADARHPAAMGAPVGHALHSDFVQLPANKRLQKNERIVEMMSSIRRMNERVLHSASRYARRLHRIIYLIMVFALLGAANNVMAQQPAGRQSQVSEQGLPVSSTKTDESVAATAKTDVNNQGEQPLTERERALLERVEKLEQRLADLESRTPAGAERAASATPAESSTREAKPLPSSIETPKAAGVPVDPVRLAASAAQGDQQAKKEPFAFGDFTWLTGNPRTKDTPLETKYFTGEFRADVAYHHDFNHPKDDTISGSSEVFRANEIQLTHLGIGGDFHIDNVRGRFMTQLGMYSQTQPRNDSSPARGQWMLDNAYRYLTEAYGGYHFDKMNGINVDAGIFLSYIGLWSFYNFDNWTYQPSFVSSNTPWFFTGVRVQIYPSDKLKIEPWFINGWQTYGKFNKAPGIGGQIAWRPNDKIAMVFNNYWGQDTLGNPGRKRIHTDDSIQVKYLDRPESMLSKAAFSVTIDAGCEYGGGTSCRAGNPLAPKQYFLGFMAYNRFWFWHDKFGLTVGGGTITNPGRYLVLIPPINGATAFSGTPYFTANPGDQFRGADGSITFDYLPSQYITWRLEYNHRTSNVPYYSGPGGVTPPGGNTGAPGSFVPGWTPDLRKFERRFTFAILVKM